MNQRFHKHTGTLRFNQLIINNRDFFGDVIFRIYIRVLMELMADGAYCYTLHSYFLQETVKINKKAF